MPMDTSQPDVFADDPRMTTKAENFWTLGGKRWFDVVVSAMLSILLSPVLLLATLAVKLTSRGPVLFSQDRGGLRGKPFRVFKFRTMRAARRPDPKELVPLDHPDITSVGWFMRRFKIDELPQLYCVLKGDMSLIGPRPTLLDQVAAYDDFRWQRLLTKPGLTGLAQVNGHAGASWDERILYDVVYVKHGCFLMDVGIMLRTIMVLCIGEKRMARRFLDTHYARLVEPPEGYWEQGLDH